VKIIRHSQEREEEIKLWRRWKAAKTRRGREDALCALWRTCRPATLKAVKLLAERLSAKKNKHITVPVWFLMHGMTEEDAHIEAFPAVFEAAKRFDTNRGAKLSTYAHPFILGRIYRTAKRNDALNLSQYEVTKHGIPQGAGTWKKSDGGRISLPGGSGVTDQEDRTDMRLRYLVELPPDDGGFGKVSSLARFLDALDVDALVQLRNWLLENQQRAVELYGRNRLHFLYFFVKFRAWCGQLPPDVRHANLFPDKPKDELPLQGVAIRTDGKKWDLDNPIRAELREQSGKRKRQIARELDMSWSTYKDLRKRTEKQGFSLAHFTSEELDAIARGNQGRSPES
jgi:hypothetical protein